MSNQWRQEQDRCQRDIERHRNADRSYLSEGVALLELANNAQRLFGQQKPHEKRRLLNFLLSNCTWNDGALIASFRQPFDMLAETITAVRSETASKSGFGGETEKWLPRAGLEPATIRLTVELERNPFR
jgi:site-specific DNA recombinase